MRERKKNRTRQEIIRAATRLFRAKVAASAISATVRAAMTEWLQDGCREDLVGKAARVLDLVQEGLSDLAPFLLQDGEGGTP